MDRIMGRKRLCRYRVRFRRGVLLHRLRMVRYDHGGVWNGTTWCGKTTAYQDQLLLARKPRGKHYKGKNVDYRKKCRKCEAAWKPQQPRKPRRPAAPTGR